MNLDAIGAVSPDIRATFERAHEVAADTIGPELFALVRGRVDFLLGGTDTDVAPHDRLGADALRLTDQFVAYVPGVGEEILTPLRESMGRRGLRALTDTLYVVDQAARLRVTHSRLFTPGELTPGSPGHANPELSLGRLNLAFHHAIMLLTAMDPVTTEVVRLRAASYHHCRLCASGRVVVDGRPLVDVELAARIDTYVERPLAPEHQAALRYADVHMIDPRRLDAELRDELRALFTPEQLVELTLDVSAYNYQKILVALSLDIPASTEGIVAFTFTPEGDLEVGELLERVTISS